MPVNSRSKQVRSVKAVEPKWSIRYWLTFWGIIGFVVAGAVGLKYYQTNVETTPTVASVSVVTPTPRCGLAKENAYMKGYQDGHDQR